MFTPREVNQVIPELERLVAQVRTLEGQIQEKEWRLRQAKVEARRRGDVVSDTTFLQEEAEIDFIRILIGSHLDRVTELGGVVKGGFLVDFPAVIEGQEVLLCWKPGERSVRWYHGLYEGFMGRKPIPAYLLDEEPPAAPEGAPAQE